MHMIGNGSSINFIHKRYGISHERLQVLWASYQLEGTSGLLKRNNIRSNYALNRQIVLDIEKNHISLHTASIKYGPSPSRIKVWLRVYRAEGLSGLERVKKRDRPPGMGRPKKNSKPLTELERLQKENQELKTEIALLKKVRALVEERNARLREIGQGPSKN